MNVYIITKQPFPYGMAAVNRIKCYAKSILSADINCKIIVWSRTDVNSQLPYKGIYDGIPYEYIGNSSKRAKGEYIGRIQSFFLQLMLIIYLPFKINQNDIVLGYGHGMKPLWRLLIFLIHKRKAFYISDLCELPYGMGAETISAINNREYYYKYMFPLFDGILAISDTLVDIAKKYCNPKCIIEKIPILVDYEKYELQDMTNEAEYPYIFHSGTLYEQKDGILGMIEAFGIATQKLDYKIHFVLTGNIEKSPHSKEIKNLIEKYQLQNVIHFTGYLSNEKLRDKLSKASLVIINKYETQQNVYCFSTKLAEYMAAGKSIIITRVGEAMNWLTDKHDCIVVEPADTNQIMTSIVEYFTVNTNQNNLGNNARKTCKKHFDYLNYCEFFKSYFKRLDKK